MPGAVIRETQGHAGPGRFGIIRELRRSGDADDHGAMVPWSRARRPTSSTDTGCIAPSISVDPRRNVNANTPPRGERAKLRLQSRASFVRAAYPQRLSRARTTIAARSVPEAGRRYFPKTIPYFVYDFGKSGG